MNFKFKLSRRLARMKLGLIIAATLLVIGCNLTSPGPEIVRIERIDVTPGRFTLLTNQAAQLEIVVTTSRGDAGGAEQLEWSTTGGVINSNGIIGNVRLLHATRAPPTPGTYLFIVTTVTGAPAGGELHGHEHDRAGQRDRSLALTGCCVRGRDTSDCARR